MLSKTVSCVLFFKWAFSIQGKSRLVNQLIDSHGILHFYFETQDLQILQTCCVCVCCMRASVG